MDIQIPTMFPQDVGVGEKIDQEDLRLYRTLQSPQNQTTQRK